MGQRKYGKARCPGCGLHLELCVCPQLPRVSVATRIVVVQQIRERFKPTNTGKLVPRMLENSTLITYGLRDQPLDTGAMEHPDHEHWVLFPREDAVPLDQLPALEPGRKRCFVVLDGTWHQCSRMTRRVPRVRDLPCVTLPPGPPSRWAGRTQHDPRGLSTFEAVARLVACCEGPEVARPLERAFARIAARLMYMKGMLERPEVPEGWLR